MEARIRIILTAMLTMAAGSAQAQTILLRHAGISAPLRHFATVPYPPSVTPQHGGIRPVPTAVGQALEHAIPAGPPTAQRPLPFVRTGGTRVNADSMEAGRAGVTGAAGAGQLVHIAGSSMTVQATSDGAPLAQPADVRALFLNAGSETAQACSAQHGGEQAIAYDAWAGRWLLSFMATPSVHCIALSVSSDAAGQYHRFAFPVAAPGGAPLHADDVRIAVWPDAYLFSYSLFDANGYRGPRMCAIGRKAMLAGADARMRCIDPGPAAGPLSPVSFDGTQRRTVDSEALFVGLAMDGAETGSGIQLWRWPLHGLMPATALAIDTAPFMLPAPYLVQPAPGAALDVLADRISAGIHMREVDGRLVLAASHPVLLPGGRTGVRWLLIGDPVNTPYVAAQGTLDTGSGNRTMSSIGIDRRGNLALAYLVAAEDTYAGIRYTGREAGDPPGMLQTEETIVNGSGVQTGATDGAIGSGALALDPADGCTFWYTQRYLPTSGTATWRTRVASFRFRSCY